MMTHVEQGELQAYLDGEVTLSARTRIESHLHSCLACTAELDRQRAASNLFASVLHQADVAAPMWPAFESVSAARGDIGRRRFAKTRSALAKAAVLVIGFAALATAAIPGSPLRQWISSALETVGITKPAPSRGPEVVNPPASPTAPATATAEKAALAIEPAAGRVLIVLTNVASDAVIRVRLVDTNRAVVQTSGGAVHARFRTSPGRIEVIGVQKGEVSIDLPRAVVDGRVQVDGRMLFQKDHDQLHLSQPAKTSGNSEFTFKGSR